METKFGKPVEENDCSRLSFTGYNARALLPVAAICYLLAICGLMFFKLWHGTM